MKQTRQEEPLMRTKLIVILFLLPVLVMAQAEKKTDLWQPLRFLEGRWEGPGQGSVVTQEYRFILNQKFLQMKTKAVFEPSKERPEGEVHEDMGLFSYDQSRKTFVLREFYVEGFINTYILDDISDDRKTLTFLTEHIENAPPGTKAKLIFKVLNPDELEQSFHIAWPDREFSCYLTSLYTS
jgi:hypothetical protein